MSNAGPLPNAAYQAKWVVGQRSREAEIRLAGELGVSVLVAAILVQRGFTDAASTYAFLNPSEQDFHDPRLLPDYEPAVKAILGARERKERIFVHGDYDVDGITSAAIFSRFLKAIGCDVHTHVPHRMRDGYGVSGTAVEAAQAMGAKLFLTCDCGIGAHEEVAQANEAGMTVVVTDHHTVGVTLPGAIAVVNVHRQDSVYPFKDLSGAGVVFKLCEGITKELGFPLAKYYRAYLDLTALGTIADVMPLVGENRLIARFGLERLRETRKPGLIALMAAARIDTAKPVRAGQVGFQLGPRLNAAGRLEDAATALRLLLTSEEAEASTLAAKLEEINIQRRAEQDRIAEEAIKLLIDQNALQYKILMVAQEGWHSGVVGIVASRLVDQFHRPSFVMSIDPETGLCKGSGRSIPGFNLAEAIEANRDLFESGGGHAMAAGCSFNRSNFEQIRSQLGAYAEGKLTDEDLVPTVRADLEVTAEEISVTALEELSKLEPFGFGNAQPKFLARSVAVRQVSPTRNPAVVKAVLETPTGRTIEAVSFTLAERMIPTLAGSTVDVLFEPEINEYQGNRRLQWKLKDFTDASAP